MTTALDTIETHEYLSAMHYDLYKDVHGVRPRWIDYDALSVDELDAMLNRLMVELKEEELRVAEFHARNTAEFEVRVNLVIDTGAGNRETALRWIMDADGAEGDLEFLCYLNGLNYGYFKEAA